MGRSLNFLGVAGTLKGKQWIWARGRARKVCLSKKSWVMLRNPIWCCQPETSMRNIVRVWTQEARKLSRKVQSRHRKLISRRPLVWALWTWGLTKNNHPLGIEKSLPWIQRNLKGLKSPTGHLKQPKLFTLKQRPTHKPKAQFNLPKPTLPSSLKKR